MKLLFLPSYFYPEKAASSYLGVNRFQAYAKEGFGMVVYAPMPSRGISPEVREEYKKRKTEKMYDGYMTVHRFGMCSEGGNPIVRALRYGLQSCKHFFYALWSEDARSCDVLFLSSTPPTQGAMGALIKKFSKKKFIYCLQDIFPDSLVGTGLAPKGGLLWKIGRVIENFTYRNADKIIVISEDFKKNIMAKGVPEEKIEVIYNWVDQDAVVDIPRAENKLFDKYGLDRNKFYITYNGNIGLTQNMEMLIDVAKELEPTPDPSLKGREMEPTDVSDNSMQKSNIGSRDIQFVLVGEGAYKEKLEKIIKEQNITNITLLPFQPYEDISHVFSLGDVSLVISKPGVGANSVPSKTWSIMSASRPVLANFDENELKTIIEEHHCGIFTKAGDKEAFKASILKLYHNPDLCKEYGKNGRQFVMDNLTKEVGTQKYVDVIKSFERI